MDKVAEQFTYLSSIINGQAFNPNPINNKPLSTAITLGSKELPYMLSMRAFGTLEILDDARADDARAIVISNYSVNSPFPFPLGAITYSSNNAYFLDQSYTYEAGAMIVNQTDGNSMMIPPFFSAYNETPDTVNISFDVVNISSVGNKKIASGYGTYPIQTEFHYDISIENRIFRDVSNITIDTPFLDEWLGYIRHSLTNVNINDEWYDSDSIWTDTRQFLYLDFTGWSGTVNIILNIREIRAQIGPGWVE
jgi:hypothetical protein